MRTMRTTSSARKFISQMKPTSLRYHYIHVIKTIICGFALMKEGNIRKSEFSQSSFTQKLWPIVNLRTPNINMEKAYHIFSCVIFGQPSWRHLPQSSEYDLISYRVSDINWTSMGVLANPRKIPWEALSKPRENCLWRSLFFRLIYDPVTEITNLIQLRC